MESECFRVRMTDEAINMLRHIRKRYGNKTYEVLRDLILGLEVTPEQKGEPLRGVLKGLFSLHYSRFRVIYRIRQDRLVVLVLGAGFHESGSRRDIYRVIEGIVKRGLLGESDEA